MSIKLVGLVGEPETGKDTIADIAIQDLGARRIGFADKIYSCALAIDPIISLGMKPTSDGTQFIPQMMRLSDIVTERGWRAAKNEIPEVRRLLQRIGTEMGRELIDKNLWISLAFRQALAYYDGSGQELDKFVFTDVRFDNEVDGLRSLASDIGGELLMVRVRREGKTVVNNHASENSYDKIKCDTTLENNGTLEGLRTETVHMLNSFFQYGHV